MLARVARYEVDSSRIDDAINAFGEAAKGLEGLEGFAGGYVLVDHEDGRTMTLTLWDNRRRRVRSERGEVRSSPGARRARERRLALPRTKL